MWVGFGERDEGGGDITLSTKSNYKGEAPGNL